MEKLQKSICFELRKNNFSIHCVTLIDQVGSLNGNARFKAIQRHQKAISIIVSMKPQELRSKRIFVKSPLYIFFNKTLRSVDTECYKE